MVAVDVVVTFQPIVKRASVSWMSIGSGSPEAMLGFALYLNERIARREQVRVQVQAAVRRKCEIADLVRGLELPTQQIAANLDMFRPGMTRFPKLT
jgi:hypothetical protein